MTLVQAAFRSLYRHGQACPGHPRGAVNDEFDIGLAGGKRF
jgi:hypothetical protein